MLSVEKCRQLLDNGELCDEVVEEVRDVLYQLARVFVENSIAGGKRPLNPAERADGNDGERSSRNGRADDA